MRNCWTLFTRVRLMGRGGEMGGGLVLSRGRSWLLEGTSRTSTMDIAFGSSIKENVTQGFMWMESAYKKAR